MGNPKERSDARAEVSDLMARQIESAGLAGEEPWIEEVGGVFKTWDYDRFLLGEKNRVETIRAELLRESFDLHGHLKRHPIGVKALADGRLEIVSGHHRFCIAREMALPIWFVIDNTEVSTYHEEATSKAWSAPGFSGAYERGGSEDYHKLEAFVAKHGCGFKVASYLLGGVGGMVNDTVRKEEFVVTDEAFANQVGELLYACKSAAVLAVKHPKNAKFATGIEFVRALVALARNPKFRPSRFLEKVSTHHHLMVKQPDGDYYLKLLNKIYNNYSKEHNKVNLLSYSRDHYEAEEGQIRELQRQYKREKRLMKEARNRRVELRRKALKKGEIGLKSK